MEGLFNVLAITTRCWEWAWQIRKSPHPLRRSLFVYGDGKLACPERSRRNCMSLLALRITCRADTWYFHRIADLCYGDVTGSRPFFVMAGMAAGDDRNWMSARAAAGSLAPAAIPAENTEIF